MQFNAPSGTSVTINVAPYEDAMELKSCILEALAATDIKIDLSNLNSMSDIDMTGIIKSLMVLDASRPVRAALFKCLSRSLYGSVKITPSVFDSEESRQDYYDIVFEGLKANLSPFLKGLALKLKTFLPLLRKTPLTS